MKNTLSILLLLITSSIFAQLTLKGKVLDEFNNPIPFVNVFLKNTTYGTTTSDDGTFFLKTKKYKGTLEISFIGFQTQTIEVNQKTNQYQTLADELDTFGEGYSFNAVEGGMFVWLSIPNCDTSALARRAIENGVAVVPSSEFYLDTEVHSSALRINFSHNPPNVLREGINRLKCVLSFK